MPTPHDDLFRRTFSDPDRARDLIRNSLPEEVAVRIDLKTLVVEDATFVDEELKDSAADLLIRTRIRGGGPAYVYILFEHKSAADRGVHLQLLSYMVRIWQRHRAHERGGLLPPVIPVVVHHGKRPWRGPLRFRDVVATEPELERFVPDFAPELFDLVTRSDSELTGDRLTRVVLLIFKHLRRNPERLAEVLSLTEPEFTGRAVYRDARRVALVRSVLYYLHSVLTDEEFRSIIQLVRVRPVKKEFVSSAETLEQRGMVREKQQILSRLLKQRFEVTGNDEGWIQRTHSPDQLDKALDAILTARSKDDVLQLLEPDA